MEEKALRRNDDLIAQVKDYHARQASSQRSSPTGTPRASPSRLSRGSRDDSPPTRRVGRHSLPGLGTGGTLAVWVSKTLHLWNGNVAEAFLNRCPQALTSSGADDFWMVTMAALVMC